MDTSTEHFLENKPNSEIFYNKHLHYKKQSVLKKIQTSSSDTIVDNSTVSLPVKNERNDIVEPFDDNFDNNVNVTTENEFNVADERSCAKMMDFDIELENFINDGNQFYPGKHVRMIPEGVTEFNADKKVVKQQNKIPNKKPVSVKIDAKKSVNMELDTVTDRSVNKQTRMSEKVAQKRKICDSRHETKQLPGNHGNGLGDVYSFTEEDAGDDDVDFSFKSFDKNVLHKRKKSANLFSNQTNSDNSDLPASVLDPQPVNLTSSMSNVKNRRPVERTLKVNKCPTTTELSLNETAYYTSSKNSGLNTKSSQEVKNYDNSKPISAGMSQSLMENVGERDKRLEAIRKVSLWIDGCTEHAISLVKSDKPLDFHWSTQTHLQDKNSRTVLSDTDKNVRFSTIYSSSSRLTNNTKTVPGNRLNSLTGSPLVSSSSASDGLVSDIRSLSGVHSNSSSGSPVFPLLNKSDGLVFTDGSTALSTSQTACVSEFGLKTATNDLILGKCANKRFNRDAGKMAIQTSKNASAANHISLTSSTRSVNCDYTKHVEISDKSVSNRTVFINSDSNVDSSVLDNSSQSKRNLIIDESPRDNIGKHQLYKSTEQNNKYTKSLHNCVVKDNILEKMAAEKSVVLDSCDSANVPLDWILEQNIGTYSGEKNGRNTVTKVSPGNYSVFNKVVENEECRTENSHLLSITKSGMKQANRNFTFSEFNTGEINEKDGLPCDLRAEPKNGSAKIAGGQFLETRSISRNLSVLDKPFGADMFGLGSYTNVNLVNNEDVYKCLKGVDGAGNSLQTGSKTNQSVKNRGTQSKIETKMMINAPKGEIIKSNNCDGKISNFYSNKLENSLYLSSDLPDCDDNSLNLMTEDFQLVYQESLEKVYKLQDIDKSVDVEDLRTEDTKKDSNIQMNEHSLTSLPESSPTSIVGIENVRYVSKVPGLDNRPAIVACSTDSGQLSAVKDLHALEYISPFCPLSLTESQQINTNSKLASTLSTSQDSVLINQSKHLNRQNGLVSQDNVAFSKMTTIPISASNAFFENSLVAKGIQNCPNDRENFQTILEVDNVNNGNDMNNEHSDHDFVLDEAAGLIDNMTEDYNWNETLKSFIMQNLDNEPKGEIEEQDSSNVKLLLEQKLAEQYLNRNIESLKRKNSIDS